MPGRRRRPGRRLTCSGSLADNGKARKTMLRQVDTTDRPPAGAARFDIAREDLDERTCVIAVGGDLDLSSAPQLKWMLLDALEEGHGRLVLDLSRATFMDSTALGVMIGVNRSLSLGAR